MTAPMTVKAPVPSLLMSLQRAGWGDLSGREWQGVRSTLVGLAAQLPHGSGQGPTTVHQVATSTGLSVRWVGRCLTVLEDLGVIEWSRGGVVRGDPKPSFIRIVKRVLLALIRAARPAREAKDEAHRAKTRARIASVRWAWSHPRRSDHVALSADPPTPKGGGSTPTLQPDDEIPMPDDVRAALRAALSPRRRR